MLLYLGRFYSVLSCCSSMLPPPWPPLLFPYTTLFRSAYAAAMKADLRIAALYEEQFAADNHGQYFGGVATADNPLNGYRPSKDVTVTLTAFDILGSQLADWTAIARPLQSSQGCEMRAGVSHCTTADRVSTGRRTLH